MIDVLIQVGCYLGFGLFILLAIDFMSARYWRTWFRVKTSSGRLVLINAKGLVQDYFRAGKIEEGFIIFKGLNKEPKRIAVPPGAVYRSMGVNCLLIDDVRNAIMLRNFDVVPGYDAEKHESLYLRALYRPTLMDNKTQVMLILLVVVLLGLAFGFYMTKSWIDSNTASVLAKLAEMTTANAPAGQAVVSGAV